MKMVGYMVLTVISVGWIVYMAYTTTSGILDGNPLVVIVSGYALTGVVAGVISVVSSTAIIKRARHGGRKD